MPYDIGAATNFGNGNDEVWDGGVLDTTRVIVNHFDATNEYPMATVLERSGSTILAGTHQKADGTNTGFRLTQGIAALTSSLAHICWTKDATPDVSYVRRLTISSRTITLGNTLTLSFTTPYPMAICRLSDTKSLLIYVKTDSRMYAKVLTDDGSDISEGAEQGWFDQAMTLTMRINVEALSSSMVTVAYTKGTLWNITLSVSGDTVALDDFASLDSLVEYPSQIRARQIVVLSSTKWVVSYSVSSTNNRLIVVEDTGSLVSGTPIQISGTDDYISAIGSVDSTHVVALVRSSLRMITFTESSRALSNDADDSTVPDSTSPSAGTPVAGYVGKVTTDEWIVATWDDNTEAQGYRATVDISSTVVMDELTLASSVLPLTIFNRATLNTLTLASSAEFITLMPVALNTLTLVGSAEFITLMPRYMQSLTLASSAETLFITRYISLNSLTLAGSGEALQVLPGPIRVVMNELTLVSSAVTVADIGVAVSISLSTLTLASSAVDLGRVQTFVFNPAQIANMRETQHESTARLTIFSPPILWSGIVSGLHDQGAVDITYTGGAGSLTFVRDFQQLIVGTAPGKDDIARLRVDDVSAMLLATGIVTVDENAIKWQSGYFIAIEHLYPIERINPRLAGGVLYKFYNQAYVDQNGQDNTDPVCLAGCDQIAELEAGSHIFNIDLSGSHPTTGGVITTYGLSVAPITGAVVAFNTGTGIGTITVSQSGYWWATCSCTDSFGNSMERFVLLRAHDSTDADFVEATITGYSAGWGRGVKMSISAHEAIALSDIPDNAIAYLWHENKFDGVEGYVNILGEYDTILFNGYVRTDRGRSDLKTGDQSANFELTTVDGLMENLPLRSITVRLKSQPDDWWQYQLLTTGEAIWFLFRWHSTVPWRHDMIGIHTFDKFVRRVAADFEEGTIFNMANQVSWSKGVIARVTCDRLGRLHFVQDTQLLNEDGRNAVISAFDITEDDVSEVIETIRQPESKVHTMQISGFSYSTSGEGTPYIAIIPGYRQNDISYSLPERRGSSFKNIPHQLLASQTEANERVGRYFAQANMPIKEFRIPFRGNYLSVLTTIPSYGWYELNVANTSIARTLEVNRIRMLCREIEGKLDSETGTFTTTGVFEPEAQGPDGIVGNYPDAQPPAVEPILEPDDDLSEALLATGSVDTRLTFPVSIEETTWTQFDASTYNHGTIDPWWRIINQTTDATLLVWVACGNGIIDQGNELDQTVVDITPATDPPNGWADSTAPTVADMIFTEIIADRYVQDYYYCVAEWQETDSGDDLWRSWLCYTTDAGVSWDWYDLYEYYGRSDEARVRNIAVNGTYLLVSIWQPDGDYFRALIKTSFFGVYNAKVVDISDYDPLYSDEVAWVGTVYDDDNLWYVFGGGINVSPADNNATGGVSLDSTNAAITPDAGVNWHVIAHGFSRITALRIGDLIENSTQRKHWALIK